ncbi:MAG: dihydrofolate reductase [Hymenobacteraceae bacterium]|nr:dihydrofolate reductase [Hymenobacteraceae bacterium]MDX5394755.1 dihydrofolate reductase [Hymenobacteraceae bacterium]MDX5510786.1 dihydrofolate reductase [Hymenobacteraceae bacterium]
MIAIVVATAENNAIGKNNELLWHLPADLKHFKQLTTGHPIIMGRKTFESIGKPLPNRTSIIVTRQADYKQENCVVVQDVKSALEKAQELDEQVFIIGGGEIYKEMLPFTDTIYLTKVHDTFDADTFFPELNPDNWQETEREDFKPDEKNKYAYSFITLKRKS